jgi:hypothetical protein
MPGHVLHLGAVVLCAHGGIAEFLVPDARVRVSGQPVVTQPEPSTITGCTLPPPPVANGPCVGAGWVSGATRVRSSGRPLVLSDSQAICAPTGATVSVETVQSRVSAQ